MEELIDRLNSIQVKKDNNNDNNYLSTKNQLENNVKKLKKKTKL